MRSKKQVEEAIKRLELNKQNSHQFNFFGEDNHIKIDIMKDVISENRNEDFIYKNYPSFDSVAHSYFMSAIHAFEYMCGELELKDLLYPENK